ncbi:MAG: SMI1/KNR4 family protein [Planctomycetes bacterium]|nr:SMI1/KNR4 family protein [Planctomycetota bacterium]
MDRIEDLMKRMRAKGWLPGGPAAEEAVAKVEKEFDVTFPADYRAYLVAAGGGDTLAPEAFTGLLPVKILSLFNRSYRIPWNFPGLFAIGNDGFLVYVFDYRSNPPVVASIGMSSSVWEDVVTETDTFAEWLERRIP